MLRNILKITALAIVTAALVVGGYLYWQHDKFYPSTDDAYVQANTVNLASQVTGIVNKVLVQNHQRVYQGELLFTISPKTFQLALNKAQANLQNTIQQVKAEEINVTAATALVEQRQAELKEIRKSTHRVFIMAKKHFFSPATRDKAVSQLAVAKDALKAANSKLAEAKEQLGDPGAANTRIRAAKVTVDQAKLNLQHTKIYAPSNGYIANLKLRNGTSVTAYQPVLILVENQTWWVNANFKETDLQRIHVGQPVSIKLDMYAGYRFKGVVQSISANSGTSFSLLPPENASGNWVKVTQRFPVKIIITNRDPQHPLRVGASADVTVDTTH